MPGLPDTDTLFPPFVASSFRRVGMPAPDPYPGELEIVKKAVEKRRSEFAAGRACARDALQRIGIAAAPILHNQARMPVWPAGVVGTIAHSTTWAGAAVARAGHCAGIGLDIETVDRVKHAIARKVLSPEEATCYECLDVPSQQAFLCLCFSAKEAVYKCLSPLLHIPLLFQDASVAAGDAGAFEVRMRGRAVVALPACACMRGRYLLHEGSMFTAIVLAE